MIPASPQSPRPPVYLTPVRDLYGLDLPDGGRVEVRRHGTVLTALTHMLPAGVEPVEFDLRRWHYRQWATQIEDREYSEGLRGLIAVHGLFEHPDWINRDRPTELDAESMTVVDDLRATWRGRFGAVGQAPSVGAQLCSVCLAATPPQGPLTVWSPAPSQQPCPHRDAAATALLALVDRYEELTFELLDLLVVAHSPGVGGAPSLRRFVLPSDWMRALLGHWLLGQGYVHRDSPWRSRGVLRHRRFSHRALRADGHGELTVEERYSALAWGISPDDLSLMPEDPEPIALPEASWWSDPTGAPPAGVRVYPEGAPTKPASAGSTIRPKAPVRVAPPPRTRIVSGPAPTPTPTPAPVPRSAPKRSAPVTKKPARAASPKPAGGGLEETLSSLTAGLAALSQIMGGPKRGRR